MIEILLDELHFSSIWNGGVLLLSLFSIIIYLFILPSGKDDRIWKTIIFIIGVFVAYIAVGSPLNIVARIKFSTHIIQIILLFLIAPPLIIIGFKNEIIRKILTFKVAQQIARMITNPYLVFILFFTFITCFHIPSVFDAARMDIYINYFYMLGLFIISILFWIPLITNNILSPKQKYIYSGVSIIAFIPLSLFLMFSTDNLYTTYSDLSVFVEALEACFPPDEEPLPPQFYESLLPNEPYKEQQFGGRLLLIAETGIFLLTIIFVNRLARKK